MRKKKTNPVLTVLFLLLLAVTAVSIAYIYWPSSAPEPAQQARDESTPVPEDNPVPSPELSRDELEALISAPQAETELGKLLSGAIWDNYSIEAGQTVQAGKNSASQTIAISYVDTDKLSDYLTPQVQEKLSQAVEAAPLSSDIYTEEQTYRDDVLLAAIEGALTQRLENISEYTAQTEFTLEFRLEKGQWQCENMDSLSGLTASLIPSETDSLAASLTGTVSGGVEYVRKIYKIDEDALQGQVPDQSRFGETDDPAVIEELLQRPEAQQLINGQSLAWNPDIELIPGSTIHYYLDESILTIVWQEEEARAVGTFSEVFIADGSQLRRRIAGDQFNSLEFETTSGFAKKTNGVLTLGGDFYNHGRACGIVVYGREIYRFEPKTSDTCYITTDGDMLFSYREQFETQEQAQAFVDENDVLFSLCFGPVLIDNGEDVTPDSYMWGEIDSNYARSVLGMLGERHYLTMNINCYQPGYYYLVKLRQAADAMIEKGCIKAYALDGGQTATTVFNGQLINPVQFGWEKIISDVIYFASAVPNQGEATE